MPSINVRVTCPPKTVIEKGGKVNKAVGLCGFPLVISYSLALHFWALFGFPKDRGLGCFDRTEVNSRLDNREPQ